MKKTFVSAFLILFASAALLAQTSQSNLFKFRNVQDADVVLKALNSELKLTAEEFPKVQNLLNTSAQSQETLYAKPENKDQQMVDVIVTRQSNHIEANLKEILGATKYKQYVDAKATIEQKVKLALKN